jgi:hypothetical protein
LVAWTILIAVFVAAVAALLGWRVYGRSPRLTGAPNGPSKTGERAEQWGVRIHVPAKERACPSAQEIHGKEFSLDAKPQLPLSHCPFPHQCQCGYVILFDRRKEDRRSGRERRLAGLRLEPDKPPRRSGKDRRKRIDWV